jgi:hypothetical protein
LQKLQLKLKSTGGLPTPIQLTYIPPPGFFFFAVNATCINDQFSIGKPRRKYLSPAGAARFFCHAVRGFYHVLPLVEALLQALA